MQCRRTLELDLPPWEADLEGNLGDIPGIVGVEVVRTCSAGDGIRYKLRTHIPVHSTYM